MKSSSDNTDDVPVPPEKSTVILLLKDTGDTTWRMFVPSVGMTLLGVWLDATFETKPWLMLAGIVIGLALAIVLVRRQLNTIKKRKDI